MGFLKNRNLLPQKIFQMKGYTKSKLIGEPMKIGNQARKKGEMGKNFVRAGSGKEVKPIPMRGR